MSEKEFPCAGEYTEQPKKTPLHQRRTIVTTAGIFEGVTVQLLTGLRVELLLEKDGKAKFVEKPPDGDFPGYYAFLTEEAYFDGQMHKKRSSIIVRPDGFAEEDKIYLRGEHPKKE
jgi:hypothetical protein